MSVDVVCSWSWGITTMTFIACIGPAVLLSANSTANERTIRHLATFERSSDGSRFRNLRDWFKDRGSKDESRNFDTPSAPARSANNGTHGSRSLFGRWYDKRHPHSSNSQQVSVPNDRMEPSVPPTERHLIANLLRSKFRSENPNQLVPMRPGESPNGTSTATRNGPSGPTRAAESNPQVAASRPIPNSGV